MSATRLQLALNVSDLDGAIDFYTRLFGSGPTKTRPGYANFAVAEPPLKLVLFEDAAAASAGALNHLGVEVATTADVAAAAARFEVAGLATRVVGSEVCCHATQDKVYVAAPDVPLGMWEYYTVVDDAPGQPPPGAGGNCCGAPADATAGAVTVAPECCS